MNKQKPTILLLLIAFIFFPTFLSWSTDQSGAWFRPFLLWFAVIVFAFVVLNRKAKS